MWTSVTSLASLAVSGSSQFFQDLSESHAGVSLTTSLLEMQTREKEVALRFLLTVHMPARMVEIIASNISKTKRYEILYMSLPWVFFWIYCKPEKEGHSDVMNINALLTAASLLLAPNTKEPRMCSSLECEASMPTSPAHQ